MQGAHLEYQVTLEDTPFGITFFEGLDIPLVEGVSSKGAAAAAAAKRGARVVRAGDRLVAINGRDVSAFSTPHVLALLAEASWRLRRSLSSGDTSEGGVVLRFRAAVADGAGGGAPEPTATATTTSAITASSIASGGSAVVAPRSPTHGHSGGQGRHTPNSGGVRGGVRGAHPVTRSPTPTATLTLAQIQLEDVHRVNELLEVRWSGPIGSGL
jgi:hypothetical protein